MASDGTMSPESLKLLGDAAEGFATIVPLILSFISERRGRSSEARDFLTYLHNLNQQRMADRFAKSETLMRELSAVLGGNLDALAEQVSEANRLLGLVVLGSGPLTSLALSMGPEDVLSTQAASLLRQAAACPSRSILVYHTSPEGWQASDGARHQYVLEDPHFLEEDMDALAGADLIRPNALVTNDWLITRKGLAVAKLLDSR